MCHEGKTGHEYWKIDVAGVLIDPLSFCSMLLCSTTS